MTRFMTTVRPRLAIALGTAALLLLPATAVAQIPDPGAPSPGTPTSNQYEIPVQAGRHDAAPPRAQRNSGGGSLYRSDNNFGSSSVVPGDPGGGGPSGGASAGGSGGGGAGGGSVGAAVAGAAGAAGAAVANSQEQLDTGSPSSSAAYTTLPLIIALGVVIGIAGVKMRRQSEV